MIRFYKMSQFSEQGIVVAEGGGHKIKQNDTFLQNKLV